MSGTLEGKNGKTVPGQTVGGSSSAVPVLHISEKTRKALGEDILKNLQSAPVRKLVVISTKDFESYLQPYLKDFIEKDLRKKYGDALTYNEKTGRFDLIHMPYLPPPADDGLDDYERTKVVEGDTNTFTAHINLSVYHLPNSLKIQALQIYCAQFPEFNINDNMRRSAHEELSKILQDGDPNYKSEADKLFNKYMVERYNDIVDRREDKEESSPMILGFKTPEGTYDFVLMVIQYPEKTTMEWAEFFSDVPEYDLNNIDINPKILLRLVAGHEKEHLNKREITDEPKYSLAERQLEKEIQSDLSGLREIRLALQGSPEKIQGTLEYFESLRAVGALRHTQIYKSFAQYSSHATSTGFCLDGHNVLRNNFNACAIGSALLNVNSMAALLAGNVTKKYFSSKIDKEGMETLEKYIDKIIEEREQKGIPVKKSDICEEITGADGVKHYEFKSPLGEMVVGLTVISESYLHYAAVKALLDKDYFVQGTAEYEAANEFVKGMERIVKPEDLSTEDVTSFFAACEALPKATPEIRERLMKMDPQDVLHGALDKTDAFLRELDEGFMSRVKPDVFKF
jgi:hypothetical protein